MKQHSGNSQRNHTLVFERFFQRKLDLEDVSAISGIIEECGTSSNGFSTFSQQLGKNKLDDAFTHARSLGVFGVPSFIFAGELFWGQDRMGLLEECILQEKV